MRNLLKEKKKSILAAAVTVAALFLVSLAIEMVGFQYHLLFLDESKKGMITYSLPDMEQSGFAQENGQLTALRDDATLHVSFDKMYVNKLEYGYSSASEFKAQVLVDTYDGYGSPDQEEMTDSSASQLKRSVQNIRMDASGITLKVPEGTTITYFQINNQLQFNYLRFGFIFVVLLLIAALYAGRKIWARKVEAGFLLVAVAIGFLLLLLLPAKNVSWDEQIHFRTAYQQSFRSKVVWTESARQLKDVVEANAYSIEERADALEYMDEHADYSDPVRIEERGKVPYYKDYSYYSQSAFLLLGRKLNLPFSVCFRLGRMGNFLFYVFLMYLAVRNIKIGKRIMALIGLLPTPLFLSAVYSYDAVITACLMLAFSIIVNELLEPEKKLSFWNAFLFIGLVVFASLPKSVYVFFILLALMLPQSKFHSKSAKWIFKTGIVLIFFILMSTYLFAAVVDPVDAADIRGGDTDVSRQLGLVLGHPLTYLEILLKDMQKSMGSYVIGSASLLHYAYLGEYTAYNLQVVMAILIAFVVLTDTFEEKDGKMLQLRAGNRVFLALVILGSAVTIWTALYIAFTPVGTMYINGVQGRYYIPLLVPLFLLFRTSKLKNSINREVYHLILFGGAAFLSLFMIYQEVLKPLCY